MDYSTAKKPTKADDHNQISTTNSASSSNNFTTKVRRSLTINMINRVQVGDTGPSIQGRRIDVCSFLGRLTDIEDVSDYFKLWINDGTGTIPIILLRGLQLSKQFENMELSEGRYYKMFALPRIKDGEVMLYCQTIKAVTNLNVISLHMADIIRQTIIAQRQSNTS